MTVIQVTKQIDSEHLDLPELRAFIGKEVSITIEEAAPRPSADRWQALKSVAGRDLIDPDIYRQQRAFEVEQQRAAADDSP
jgi:hypothetical protein